jgi:hypothetical protein
VDSDGTACAAGDTACGCAACNLLGQGCGSPANCCSGLKCDTSGTPVCAQCLGLGSGCAAQGDCCNTLYCSDPNGYTTGCSTPGACSCLTCLPVATPCTFAAGNCCGAAQCLTAGFSGCPEDDSEPCSCQENL